MAKMMKVPRILVVEDNEVNQKVLMGLLNHMNYGADVADDAEDAMRYLVKNVYDLVLMDIEMPKMNGIELTRVIREGQISDDNRDVFIIAVTVAEKKRKDCFEAGMNAFLPKPIRFRDLKDTIVEVFGELV